MLADVRQPPSGGCVLKPSLPTDRQGIEYQPPSGGCVLKPSFWQILHSLPSAAFGRLCVETGSGDPMVSYQETAAFGRLCVETISPISINHNNAQPPSGGCVLKLGKTTSLLPRQGSRLRAAVC